MKNVAIIVIAVLFSFSTTVVAQGFTRSGDVWPPANSGSGFAPNAPAPSFCEQVNQCNRGYAICANAQAECADLKAQFEVLKNDLAEMKKCVTCAKPAKKAKVKKLAEDAAKLPPEIQKPFNERVLVVLGKDYYSKADVDLLIVNLRDLLEARVGDLEKRADKNDREHEKIGGEQKVQDKRMDKLEKDVGGLLEAFDLEVVGGFAFTPKFFGGGGGLGIVYRLSDSVHLELTGVVGGGSDYDLDVGGQMVAFGSVNVFYQWKYGAIGGNALAASMKPVETERNTSFSAYGGGLMLRVNTAHENPVRFFITGTVDVVGYSDWDNTPGHPDAIPWDCYIAGTFILGLSFL
ncbi:MAG: hypothetical protein PHD72_01315 [Patescibacteria group bacterium]|nr:hypothetical protein [Patescibacteria group bacterium]